MRTLTLFAVLGAGAAQAELISVHPVDEAAKATPVRMQIIDAAGTSHIPTVALPIQLNCPSQPVPNEAPGCATGFSDSNFIDNPHTGTRQFYVEGDFDIDVPVGHYVLTAYKGIEYSVTRVELDVKAATKVTLPMKRWVNLARRGWVSADDHLHIGRASPSDNAWLSKWMQAEDLGVANLLTLGNQQAFEMAAQFAYGDPGVYLSGGTMLLSGQEHPRTHVLGHSIILGADAPIDLRETYSLYNRFFTLAKKLSGVNGYAHWGLGAGENGLAVDAPHQQLSFIEVLQFEYPNYSVWYELLNLGIPLAPTAGTDFPCGPWSVPGRERFYTRIEGELSRAAWLEGVRKGRTFVTNGPLLELRVEDADIGELVTLKKPGMVTVQATITFDPSREKVEKVQLIRNGVASPLTTTQRSPGVLHAKVKLKVDRPEWLALRASGSKVGEVELLPQKYTELEYDVGSTFGDGVSMKEREKFATDSRVRPSEAHTGAIYLQVAGGTPVARQAASQALAKLWLAKLDALEASLEDKQIGKVPLKLGALPNSDGLDLKDLMANRKELRVLIGEARAYFTGLLD